MKHILKLKPLLLLIIFTVVAIFPWSPMMEAQKEVDAENGLEITFLVFSGRENPSFIVSDVDILKQFEELVNQSKIADAFQKDTVIPSILGYNGIIVKPIGEPGVFLDLKTLAIYNGYIEKQIFSTTSKSGVEVIFLIDNAGDVENFLLNLALNNGTIDQKIYDFIKKK